MTPVTPAGSDVIQVQEVDERSGFVYYIASPDNPTQRYLFRARLDGRGRPERLTPASEPGTHAYQVSPDGRWAFPHLLAVRHPAGDRPRPASRAPAGPRPRRERRDAGEGGVGEPREALDVGRRAEQAAQQGRQVAIVARSGENAVHQVLAQLGEDNGERRTNLDILNLTGEVGEVTAKDLATLRAMLAGLSARSSTISASAQSA